MIGRMELVPSTLFLDDEVEFQFLGIIGQVHCCTTDPMSFCKLDVYRAVGVRGFCQ